MSGPESQNGVSLKLSEMTFVVFDLETTGFSPHQAGITEIGAVTVQGGETLSEFSTFVNPGHTVPSHITGITGISNHDVVNAPSEIDAVAQFFAYVESTPPDQTMIASPLLVAHNANFDLRFLHHVCRRDNHPWPEPKHLDTLKFAQRVFYGATDGPANYKLDTLAEHFNTPTTPTHRALDDAKATATILNHLLNHVATQGIHDVDALISWLNRNTRNRI